MDARSFFDLAAERGFVERTLLLDERATCAAVRAKIAEIAAVSEPGDLVLLTFSGHGGRTRLQSGEVGTWQLYDGTLNDEQLKADFAGFRAGVRVLVVSDNCGGGLPARSLSSPEGPEGSIAARPAIARPASARDRLGLARAAGLAGAGADREARDGELPPSRPALEGFLRSSVLVLAACQPGRYADGPGLPGHFTAAFKRALNVNGSYRAFHQALCEEMPSYQKPDYYRLGVPSPAFESQRPFTI